MSEWQPIETAPKDGTKILVWWRVSKVYGLVAWGEYNDGSGEWQDEAGDVSGMTHWMPLPKAPE